MIGAPLRVVAVLVIVVGCGPSDRLAIDAASGDAAHIDGGRAGAFGDPCSRHVDCSDGYCIEPAGGVGGQCTRTCHADCPTGWDCLSVEFPESKVDLCVPATGRLCEPCANDSECPGTACLVLDGEPRCAVPCSTSASCPTHYTCGADPVGAHPGLFCQPMTGSCTCKTELSGAVRTCNMTNPIGTCLGTQTCSGSGWSSCTAHPPATETCDGVDNDCDFVVDDGVGGGDACANTNTFGSCAGLRTCAGVNGFVCNGPTPKAELCNSVDDNCNGTIDEGFPGLGDLCNAGVGACLRYGSMRCNTAATGIECGAVAGAPVAETCNHLDDDCNGQVDETYPTLGMACSSGIGVCARFGSYVCRADTMGTECSAVPGSPTGADTCNYLDDDCDGTVDNSFRDPGTGTYDTDQNCGACGIDCAAAFPGAQNATGGCVSAGATAACGLRCAAGAFNLNSATSDGCEFLLDGGAIYVSGADSTAIDDSTCGIGPSGTGAANHPCRTISYGNLLGLLLGRARVLVADGTYNESVTIGNGVSLLGGYRADTWERHLATTATVIQGTQLVGGVHEAAVIATSVTTPTVFEGFVVRGSSNTRAGGNSYAIYVAGSNASLVIKNNDLFGGRGGPASTGTPGLNGQGGASGASYSPAAYDSFQATGAGNCPASNNRAAYGAGLRTCGGVNVNGGDGGGNNCQPLRNTQNSTATSPASAGLPGGGAGGGTAGSAGGRGYDADQMQVTCFVPTVGSSAMFGSDGIAGGSGQAAGGVAGCTAPSGGVVGAHWVGGAAGSGTSGFNGGGGGGGGPGGGATCSSCNVGNTTSSLLGGHGGGAGSGGCGGGGGTSGGSGGGAFVVFITGGAAPTMTGNSLTLGTGGAGGSGGIGGSGGLGGSGSQGGQTAALFCTGKGGRGGDGGNGGAGAGGGGGCGGASFGIFTSGVGTPNLCATNTLSGGSPGPGGPGGFSAGASGQSGVSGALANCTSI